MTASLPVKLLDPDAVPPQRAKDGDAGYDLCCLTDFTLAPGERARIPTGVAIELPSEFCALVLPRSGLAHRHGIALVNAPGLIDSGYRGEIQVLLLNTDREEPFSASAGNRIAQLLLVRYEALAVELAVGLSASARGAGGFGSSGR